MLATCVKCGSMVEQTARVDHSGEVVIECALKHFIKIPRGADVLAGLAKHDADNAAMLLAAPPPPPIVISPETQAALDLINKPTTK